MIVTPDKLQAIVVRRNCQMSDTYSLKIMTKNINSQVKLKLLGTDTDNNLIDSHDSTTCRKASS